MESPSVTYHQRKNSGQTVFSLNEAHLPHKWMGLNAGVGVKHYSDDTALTSPYLFMFQKVSEKALSK